MHFKLLSNIIPKSLFARFIFIILVPTIITQAVAIFVFYNRHWHNVSKHMKDSLIGDIETIIELYDNNVNPNIIKSVENKLHFIVIAFPNKHINNKPKKYDNDLQNLNDSLASTIKYPIALGFDHKKNYLLIEIDRPDGILNIFTSTRRINNPTTHIFILWMTGTGAVFLLLSVWFSSKQIRPIIKLARAAEKFGKGQNVPNLKPEGALEVRKATNAFIKMKDRIEKQITQRMEMLAGISHDLRTPLTRMKLRLAVRDDDKDLKEIQKDIEEMQDMVNSFLNFVRGDAQEEMQQVNIYTFLNNIINSYSNSNIYIKTNNIKKHKLMLRKKAIKRALSNLIDNSIKYGKNILVNGYLSNNFYVIEIEDDGIGINDDQFEDVFKPFYRIEPSRNKQTGGIGLGLTITRDIISSHGGEINLARSRELGGLKAIIKLPL
jgi:two-component system, OmpR family, osmolarity sensor histidine kinase EnvZ